MNSVGKSFHVSHHLNAFNGSANDFEVWYFAGNEEARKLAQAICDAVCKVTGWVNRGAKATTSLYVIRASEGSAILIEWGFMDSQKDMDIMAKKMDDAVNAALDVMGYKSSSNGGVAKVTNKKTYIQNARRVEVIRESGDQEYMDLESTNMRGNYYPKGSKLLVKEVVKHGNITRLLLETGGYFTANEAYVKKLR